MYIAHEGRMQHLFDDAFYGEEDGADDAHPFEGQVLLLALLL